MEAQRQISHDEGQLFASKKGVKFIETSAKTGENIEKIFADIAREFIRVQRENKVKDSSVTNNEDAGYSCKCELV